MTTPTQKVAAPPWGAEIVHLEDPRVELEKRPGQGPHPQSRVVSVSSSSLSGKGCARLFRLSHPSISTVQGALPSCRGSQVTRRRGMSGWPCVGGQKGTELTARAEGRPRERGYRSLGSHCGLRAQNACQRHREDVPLQ